MIDRDKVIKALECCDSSVFDCEHCSYGNPLSSMDECHDRLLRDAWELLKEQEGIVRCRDCKYHHYDQDQTPYCDRLAYEGIGWKDNDFCSYAEKRWWDDI